VGGSRLYFLYLESNVWDSVVCDLCKRKAKNYRNCAKCHLHFCLKCGVNRCPVCERGTLLDPNIVVQ
jgi:hypothetical protein